MTVPIFKEGEITIASIIGASALDAMDFFAPRTGCDIAEETTLRRATEIISRIQPDTPFSVATAISEISPNIVDYAEQGTIALSGVSDGGGRGALMIAQDKRPRSIGSELSPTIVRYRTVQTLDDDMLRDHANIGHDALVLFAPI